VTQFLPPPSRDPERELCNGKRCTFTWGIFAERRFALASDMPGGLWVFRVR
jgi:hypothetical protein